MGCVEQYSNLGMEESQLRRHGLAQLATVHEPNRSHYNALSVLVPPCFLGVSLHHSHALGALMGGAIPCYFTQCSSKESNNDDSPVNQ